MHWWSAPWWTKFVQEGREAWPQVELEPAVMVEPPTMPPPDARCTDLYLAWACEAGVPEALSAFQRVVLADLPAQVARFGRHVRDDRASAFVDEVRQRLLELLFVGPAPRIRTYSGRGPLGAWVRVVAVRLALRLAREQRQPPGEVPLPQAGPDPELQLLRARSCGELEQAFLATVAELCPDERVALRLYYLDGLTVVAIGRACGVHASTVVRWLARARSRMLERTRARLADQLELSPSETRSLLKLAKSHLSISASRLRAELA
jgi:RNA polymerase sigma-70 factor (ECF subfamily)